MLVFSFHPSGASQGLQLGDDAAEFFDKRVVSCFAEFVHERPVIPESSLFFPRESIKDCVAMRSDIVQRFSHVRELVRRGDQTHFRRFACQARDVGAFALHPWRFRFGVGIGAPVDDVRDALAEFSANFAKALYAALVFHGVVKQCGDSHFFVATILDHNGRDTKKMPDVGTAGALASLARVKARSIP